MIVTVDNIPEGCHIYLVEVHDNWNVFRTPPGEQLPPERNVIEHRDDITEPRQVFEFEHTEDPMKICIIDLERAVLLQYDVVDGVESQTWVVSVPLERSYENP